MNKNKVVRIQIFYTKSYLIKAGFDNIEQKLLGNMFC